MNLTRIKEKLANGETVTIEDVSRLIDALEAAPAEQDAAVATAKRAARTNGYLQGFGDAVRLMGHDMETLNPEREDGVGNYLIQIERRNQQARDEGRDEPVD